MLYGIHVSVRLDQSLEAFLYFELTSIRDSPPRRRWWQFWKWKYGTAAQQSGRS
jgi:hypothetical protein